ncbi:diaminopropionate ammonia-lyase [Clostridium sp. JNZ X4-2]
MNKKILWKKNTIEVEKKKSVEFLGQNEIKKVKEFHESFPQYSETPLVNLDNLARKIGVGGIYVKDESYRFGLNAFKVLGGSFSMGSYLAQRLNKDISELGYKEITSDKIRKELGEITFITATDGNHGRGVAWTASQLKQKSVVYMPKGSSDNRFQNIKNEGADVTITDLNYDDAVRLANKNAEKNGWVMVQDTAWEGYEKIPTWIMQGYGTMSMEALEQLRKLKVERPTHIFIQAGVGSLAGSVQGFFASVFGDDCPKTVVVEADEAACLYKSAVANDGKVRSVGGDMPTIMAGLACGEANTIGWEVLKSYSSEFVACPDWVTAKGMRVLGNPLRGDNKVISGESGAVTTGLLCSIMTRDDLKGLREELGLDENSKVLLFSTEGDTDPDKYRKIVWDGDYQSL